MVDVAQQGVAEQTAIYHTRTDCRMCGSEDMTQVWSFGETPMANEYLRPDQIGQEEPFAPLNVWKCNGCHLVQLRDVVDPKLLFSNYLYVSSTSPRFVEHFVDYATTLIDRFTLNEGSFVVDVGSNDGVLLKPLQDKGVRILGIDPAENIAAKATADGIPTEPVFLIPEEAEKLASEHGKADVISANNVFAHTDLVDEFIEGVKVLLNDDGVYVFEVQYLGDLLKKNLFDIVYHEHVCYYHIHPLTTFFEKHGMEVFDVERPDVHGGSIRVYTQKQGGPHKKEERLEAILKEEEEAGLNTLTPYEEFWERIEKNKEDLKSLLTDLKGQGKTIAAYGAPAKATTLCYAFDIDGNLIDFIVDDSPLKQGLMMPGTHIPIVSSEEFYKEKPNYCLILAWNFADPIMENNQTYVENGGKFIVPVPEVRVV